MIATIALAALVPLGAVQAQAEPGAGSLAHTPAQSPTSARVEARRGGRQLRPIAVIASAEARARVLRAERIDFHVASTRRRSMGVRDLALQRRTDRSGTRWIEFH